MQIKKKVQVNLKIFNILVISQRKMYGLLSFPLK